MMQRVVLVALLAGVVGCSGTETKEALYAKRLKRCQELNLKVAVKAKEHFDGQRCNPPGSGMDHLHRTLMELAESLPRSATCSVHGAFFICETEGGPLLPSLPLGPKGKHQILYHAEEAKGWQAIAIPSDSALLEEWSRQIRLLPDDPRGPKGK